MIWLHRGSNLRNTTYNPVAGFLKLTRHKEHSYVLCLFEFLAIGSCISNSRSGHRFRPLQAPTAR